MKPVSPPDGRFGASLSEISPISNESIFSMYSNNPQTTSPVTSMGPSDEAEASFASTLNYGIQNLDVQYQDIDKDDEWAPRLPLDPQDLTALFPGETMWSQASPSSARSYLMWQEPESVE
eukprot:NODE_2041_length_1000_cov_79.539432_g1665_i0.p2 GENE.NODE_2041_length_1000_cov_79.539432_g1665_i0~~NODE_2041_length_1000_cov_79.539432_g1665_i0.p2  ORF type:complete len:120 (+),score=21.59 NODE_2041_length_1000_cov_79.539432_g1665_i0:537-896(+)